MSGYVSVVNEADRLGLITDDYAPGDGTRRIRFFSADHTSGNGLYTAIGSKEALIWLHGYAAGLDSAATRETKPVKVELVDSRAERILAYLRAYKAENGGNSPSFRQISAACEIRSTSHVKKILDDLERVGKVRRVRGRACTITVLEE